MDVGRGEYSLYSDLTADVVDWLWYPYIPCGKITLLQGDPGDGKSTMVMDLIGKLTTGRKLPDERIRKPINVIYQCSEDSLNDTIKPRLIRAGADCNRVGYINEETSGLALDDEEIRNAVAAFRAELLVLDPVQAYIGDTDLFSAVGVRKLMRRLNMWATTYGCSFLLIGHLTKKSNAKELYRGLGSIDLAAMARSVLQIERDIDNPDIRILKHIKSNLAPKGEELRFTITADGHVMWDAAKLELIKNEIQIEPELNSKQEKVAELLKELLSKGPVESTVVQNTIVNAGISPRTMKLTKNAVGIVSKRMNNRWYWCLPNIESAKGADK